MPNWVKSIIKTKPETLNNVMKKYSDKNKFSLNKVIPMPKDLDVNSGNTGAYGLIYLYLDTKDCKIKSEINEVFKSLNPFTKDIEEDSLYKNVIKNKVSFMDKKECIDLANKYISNYRKYGHCTWYEWCRDNWGTKWDVIDFSKNSDTMMFETAWAFPWEVILELSKKYPESVFECKYADESIKENSGMFNIQDGEIIQEIYDLTEEQIKEIWNTYIDDTGQKDVFVDVDSEMDM